MNSAESAQGVAMATITCPTRDPGGRCTNRWHRWSRAIAKVFLRELCRIPEADLPLVKGHLVSTVRILLNRSPVAHRGHLPILLRLLQLRGEGVEVGAGDGQYSEMILRLSLLSRLHSIDAWKTFPQHIYHDLRNAAQPEHDRRYRATVERLQPYQARSRILRMTSQEAAGLFGDGTLEFVYIDANHSYEVCRQDLGWWWPKVKPGGVFAGHDYLDGEWREGSFGVKRAVDEFVQRTGQTLCVTPEQPWPTWYLVKDVGRINERISKRRLLRP